MPLELPNDHSILTVCGNGRIHRRDTLPFSDSPATNKYQTVRGDSYEAAFPTLAEAIKNMEKYGYKFPKGWM